MKFLLVVVVLGVAVYLVVRLLQRRGPSSFRRGATTRSAPKPKPKPTQPRRPVAPDDDPDFLRDLDRKKRHRHQDDPDA